MAQKKNLVGQRFGHLTVIEKTGETQNRYCVWRCRCDCGGEICVNTKRLMRGTVTNCGCIPKTTARNGSVAEDLTGRKYGSLTVLYRGENKNGRTRWVCKCSCGNEITVNAQQLKAGKRKSCGCQTQRFAHNKRDLTNQRFGRLVALYSTENRDSKGSVFWHCRCDCGKELDVTQDGLVYGSYRSCGCLKKEIQKKISTHLHLIDHTCLEWLENRKHRRDNTSGFRGIYRLKNGHYRVGIGFKKKNFYIGTYRTFEDAVSARLKVENQIHGNFVKGYYIWMEKAISDPVWAKNNPYLFEVEKTGPEVFHIVTNISLSK